MVEQGTGTRTVVWRSAQYPGLEHLTLETDADGVRARSVVVGVTDVEGFRLDYNVVCDPDFRVRKARLFTDGKAPLHLLSDGEGNWTDWAGLPLFELTGCVDLDVSATPFTNTLPIRRVAWQVGQSEVFRVGYVHVPALALSAEWQRYTCLELRPDGGLFRFESLDSDFAAELPVDADGLVLDYPGLFERVWPHRQAFETR